MGFRKPEFFSRNVEPGIVTIEIGSRHLDRFVWMLDACSKDDRNMKKICKTCKEERDAEEDFSWEYKSLGIRQKRCKFCQAELKANLAEYQAFSLDDFCSTRYDPRKYIAVLKDRILP